MKKQINIRFFTLLGITVLVGIWRVVSHKTGYSALSNFTPIGAMALFGGAYFKEYWKAFSFPLLALFLSDVVMMEIFYGDFSNGILYNGWYWTYGAFILMVIIGQLIKKVSFRSVVFSAFGAALAHWIITDFGVWLMGCTDITTGKLYTKDFAGLIKCYTLAIPYFKNMLLGNLIYGAILFGGFEFAKSKFPVLKLSV
jgi:hypothetical protein